MEKQLKATELRLNNLIYDVNNNLCCVSNLRKDLIIAKYLDIGSALGGVEDFKGVPLTEEILLRLGFEKHNNPTYFYSRKLFHRSLNIILHTNFCRVKIIDQEIALIKYLHSLQNLFFSLTGEELTFKN